MHASDPLCEITAQNCVLNFEVSSASKGFAPMIPHQGFCPWTPLGALPPDPRIGSHSRARHERPSPTLHFFLKSSPGKIWTNISQPSDIRLSSGVHYTLAQLSLQYNTLLFKLLHIGSRLMLADVLKNNVFLQHLNSLLHFAHRPTAKKHPNSLLHFAHRPAAKKQHMELKMIESVATPHTRTFIIVLYSHE